MKVKTEREELEKILLNSPEKLDKHLNKEEIPGLQAEPIMDIDFLMLKTKCETEAKLMILNSVKFVLPADMIQGNEYLQNKIEVDSLSLSGMIYQLRINEIMQKSLVEQVNLGMINPRMWEVFGQLSKIIGELNKQLLQTVEAIQSTYKSLKDSIKEQRTEALGPQNGTMSPTGLLTTSNGSVVTRGTKELINNVKNMKRDNINVDLVNDFIDDAGLIPNITITDIGIPPIEIKDPPLNQIIM